LTYSFDQNFDGPSQDWTADWMNAVTSAFNVWSTYANIHFVQVGTPNAVMQHQSTADIAISLGPDAASTVAGIGVFPDPDVADKLLASLGYSRNSGDFPYPNPEGDISYNPAQFLSLLAGSEGFEIILHEIGHALGLKHADDHGGNGRPSAPVDNGFQSVMWSGPVQALTADLGTPMPNDVLAIQLLYGANPDYHGGDDVYSADNPYPWTVWDTGGNDTLKTA